MESAIGNRWWADSSEILQNLLVSKDYSTHEVHSSSSATPNCKSINNGWWLRIITEIVKEFYKF